ncbi:MAG: Rab family GTPase [Candidatus Njordarchaeia archaeon]
MFRPLAPTWKFIIVGDYAVGKTSLCKVFSGEMFKKEYKPTIGVDIFTRIASITDNFKVRFQIWDMAGQERFKHVMLDYFKGAKAGAVVFDITRLETFESVEEWVQNVRKYSGLIPLILVGNKLDLDDERIVASEEGEELAEKLNLIGYLEASAKLNKNVEAVFIKPIQYFYEKYKEKLNKKF